MNDTVTKLSRHEINASKKLMFFIDLNKPSNCKGVVMQPQLSLDEKLNFLTVDILEALDIYPAKNTTDLIDNIISEHFENIINNQNTLPKLKTLKKL